VDRDNFFTEVNDPNISNVFYGPRQLELTAELFIECHPSIERLNRLKTARSRGSFFCFLPVASQDRKSDLALPAIC
jgi:hypothetical protein